MWASVSRVTRSLIQHWSFACTLAGRDAIALNKGALMGAGWLMLRPLMQVSIYVFIITYVFNVRPGAAHGTFDYALHILSGLVIWQMLHRSIEESPSLLRDRMDFIKQIVYPVETLPLTTMLAGAGAPLVGILVYLLLAAVNGTLGWSVLLLPVPLALLIIFLLGLSWTMMIAGVVIKDLREMVSVVMGLLMFLSPVLIAEDMVPPHIWTALLLNPLSHVIVVFRDAFLGSFHPASWAVFTLMAGLSFATGAWVVDHMKQQINEYL